jgi:activating signal cointegrator 1
VKCLSITQPWATLLVLGVKRVETRSWPTTYRGPLAIQAAKGWDASARALADKLLAGWKSLTPGAVVGNMPRGAVVGVVDLTDCRIMTLSEKPRANEFSLTVASELWSEDAQRRGEGELGGYEEGRYDWTVKNPRELLRPVACAGKLGIFELPPEIACAVEAELVDPTREAFEERAAILEFDAGLPRAEAERQAELFTRREES